MLFSRYPADSKYSQMDARYRHSTKLLQIAGKLHDRIEEGFHMITLTDCSACSLQWGHIPSPSLMLEEQWLHKKKPQG